jgi:hypothetical protein
MELHPFSVTYLLRRAMEVGPIEAALSHRPSREATSRKLSDEDEQSIFHSVASGQHSKSEMARRFGVSRNVIYGIMERRLFDR